MLVGPKKDASPHSMLAEMSKVLSTAPLHRRSFVVLALLMYLTITFVQLVSEGFRRMGSLLSFAQPKELTILSIVLQSLSSLNVSSANLNGNTLTPDGSLNVNFGLTLGPDVGGEIGFFPLYIEALGQNAYSVFWGTTAALWSRLPDVASALGGVNFGGDWWDVQAATVASTSYISFTGVPANMTLLTASYSSLAAQLRLNASGLLSEDNIHALLPKSAVPKVAEAGKIVFKTYSTDPQRLTYFNLVFPDASWLSGLGASDIVASSSQTKCQLRQFPSLKKLRSPAAFNRFADQGCWVNASILPSAPYASYVMNATDLGEWVVECVTPAATATCSNMRWHARMYDRTVSTMYFTKIALSGPRHLVISQNQLLRLVAGNTTESSIGVLSANVLSSPLVGDGTYSPGPLAVYLVDTDTLKTSVRWPYLILWVLCLLVCRSTYTGICTQLHFLLESPLAIFLDCIYALALFCNGPRFVSILLTLQGLSVQSYLRAWVLALMTMRPFTTLYMIAAKQIALLVIDRQLVLQHMTIVECSVLMLIGVILIQCSAPSVVDVGMRADTTLDQVISFVYSTQVAFCGVAITFLLTLCLAVTFLRHKSRRSSVAPGGTHRARSLTSYDIYLADKWLSFGVTLLRRCSVRKMPCVMLDGASLWLEALCNWNVNLFTNYAPCLSLGCVLYMDRTGRLFVSDWRYHAETTLGGDVLVGGTADQVRSVPVAPNVEFYRLGDASLQKAPSRPLMAGKSTMVSLIERKISAATTKFSTRK